MKNFKKLQADLARRVSRQKLRDRRLLEDVIQIRHLPTHTTRAYRKYRLNAKRIVEVETLLEMEVTHA
jgi:hypothetical protein